MPATIEDIVHAATNEWNYWGQSTWNCITGMKSSGFHIDDEVPFAEYVRATYLPLFYDDDDADKPSVDAIRRDKYYWSAVTISYIMKTARFTKSEFPFSESHSTYLRWGIKSRKQHDQGAAYWGYRFDEADAQPAVGDLIGCAFEANLSHDQKVGYYENTHSYHSHADIVVARRLGEIDVIGGNVRDSVTKKTLALNNHGQLADKQHSWFVVLKKRN
jgi:hypothetical protein